MNTSKRPGTTPADIKIGKRLRTIREIKGYSQTELGEKVGLSYQQIQKYETGLNRISAVRLKEFAGVLNVPLPYFFDVKNQEKWDLFEALDKKKPVKDLWSDIPPGNIKAGLKILLYALSQAQANDAGK